MFIAGGIAFKKVKHFLFSSVLGSTDTFGILLFGKDEVQVGSTQSRMTRTELVQEGQGWTSALVHLKSLFSAGGQTAV